MQLLKTISPSGAKRYFVNGKRVHEMLYDLCRLSSARLECLQTTIKRGTIRHYAITR